MKYFSIFPLLLVLSVVPAFNLELPENATLQRKRLLPVMSGMAKKDADSYPRIVLGQEATPHEFPFMVGLDFAKGPRQFEFCGGSLIDHEWVLTAAHCTIDSPYVKVYLGMHTRGSAALKLTSRYIVAHEEFDDETHKHDIAVVKIDFVHYGPAISEIDLPPNSFFTPSYSGMKGIAMGWGLTNRNGNKLANNLQHITLNLIKSSRCERTYGTKIYKGKFCADGATNRGTCRGDSGGPMVLETAQHILIGINSFSGYEHCLNGDPEAFTRVHYYLKWIHDETGIHIN